MLLVSINLWKIMNTALYIALDTLCCTLRWTFFVVIHLPVFTSLFLSYFAWRALLIQSIIQQFMCINFFLRWIYTSWPPGIFTSLFHLASCVTLRFTFLSCPSRLLSCLFQVFPWFPVYFYHLSSCFWNTFLPTHILLHFFISTLA